MKPQEPGIAESTVERWLTILRAIARHPGIKPDDLKEEVDVLLGKANGASTIYKDLKLLKERGLLEPGRHRQGYFLAGTSLAQDETQVLLNGLRIQAEDLGYPVARELYDRLMRRAAVNRQDKAFMSMPVESIGNQPVVKTTHEDFQDVMAYLRDPILSGRKVKIRQSRNTWHPSKGSVEHTIYPLQFIFHDVAWYLLAEEGEKRTFVILRVDRLHPALTEVPDSERGSVVQRERLELARRLLRQGWGTAMPPHDSQGKITAEMAEVQLRFSKDAGRFILENQQRHETQQVEQLKGGQVLLRVWLPRSQSVFFQFRRWVLSWGDSVEVLAPGWFRAELKGELDRMGAMYEAQELSATVPEAGSETLSPQG